MVVCRYFQQGTCKFGQSCRFEHTSPQYGGSYVSPLLRSSQPPPNVTAPRPVNAKNAMQATKDARDIQQNLILKDINESEKGDLSPEEMRHLQMQAQATGTIDACNRQIQQMYQHARLKFNSLKNPSPETLSIIETLIRGPNAPSSQFSFARASNVAQDSWPSSVNQTSVFGGSSATPSTTGQNSIFGGPSGSTSSGFSLAQSLGGSSQFGSPTSPQKSLFGGATAQPQQTAFGGSFGGSSQQAAPSFGGAALHTSSSVFGTAPSVGQSGGSLFGGSSAAPSTTASSFSLPNIFGGNAGATQAAAVAATSTPFGAPLSSAPNVFGGGAVENSAQPAGSLFRGYGAPQSAIIVNSSLFTSSSGLSVEEKKEYEAEFFTLGFRLAQLLAATGRQQPIFCSPFPTSPFSGPAQQAAPSFGGAALHTSSSVFAAAPSVGQSGGSLFGGSSAAPSTTASSFSFARIPSRPPSKEL